MSMAFCRLSLEQLDSAHKMPLAAQVFLFFQQVFSFRRYQGRFRFIVPSWNVVVVLLLSGDRRESTGTAAHCSGLRVWK